MKPLKMSLLISFLAMIMLTSCYHDDILGIRGEGPTISENRSLRDFSRISLAVSGEIFLTQGTAQQVRIEAQHNILNILQTDVRNGRLEIDFGPYHVRRYNDIKIYITVPDITALKVSGSGKITGENNFDIDNLVLEISGSGNIDFGVLNSNTIDGDISGSGNLLLNGDCENLDMDISGSGKLYAYDLIAQQADISISGSGRSDVYVEEFLKARVSGSGSIHYKGNPIVDVHVSGSGKVVHVE